MGESTNKFAMKAMLRHHMEQWRKLQKPMWILIGVNYYCRWASISRFSSSC